MDINKFSKNRIWEIDSIRGIAVIGMIIFHIFYILNFFDVVKNEMYSGGWLVLARFVQISFLSLVGFSMTLSKSSYKYFFFRGLKVLLLGMVISVVTYIFKPEVFVKFGILHLIGISIIILAPIAHRKYLSLLGAILAILIWKIISITSSASMLFYVLGFKNSGIQALDFFPVFPWISVILFGIFIGNLFKEFIAKRSKINMAVFKVFHPLTRVGQNSLLIYMVHIPIIIATLVILKIIPIRNLF